MRSLDGGDALTGAPTGPAALDLDMPWVLLACTRLRGTRLSCSFADRDLQVVAPAPLLREVVDTFQRAAVPRRWMEQASARWSRETLHEFLHYLISAGVLVPVAAMARGLWEYARNPRRFGEQPDAGVIAQWVAAADRRRDAGADIRVDSRSVADSDPLFVAADPRPGAADMAESHHCSNSTVSLQPAALDRLRGLIESRRSVRRFSSSPVPVGDLAAIGWALCGLVHREDGTRGGTTPSAGALYPLRFHFVNLRGQDDFPAGIYRMHSAAEGQNVAYSRVPGAPDDLYATLGDPGLLDNAQGVAVVSGAFSQSGAKYGPRALSYVLLEAGHAAQNALLAAVERQVGAVEIGGFNEAPLARLLRLEQDEDPLIMLVFGKAPEQGIGYDRTPRTASETAHGEDTVPLVVEWLNTQSPPMPLSFHIARARYRDGEEWSFGRDTNPRRAFLKAAMEAEERAACSNPSGLLEASFVDLRTAVDPRELMAYVSAQYRQFGFPYAPFNPNEPYLWKEGTRLDDGATAHILADLVYFDGTLRPAGSSTAPYTSANSSGVAAHDTLDQAIESALLELIERDAFMRLWLGAGNAVPIPKTSLADRISASVARMADAGVSVSLRQLGSPCGVPVAFAYAQSTSAGFTRVATCAHYTLDSAMDHAMDELESQVAHTLAEPRLEHIGPRQVQCAEDHGKLYAQRRYYRRAQHLLKLEADMNPPPATTMQPGLDSLRQALRARDMPAHAIDLTRPERPDVRVARAFVPGLIPIKFGYGNEPAGLRAVRDLPCIQRKRPVTGFPHPFV